MRLRGTNLQQTADDDGVVYAGRRMNTQKRNYQKELERFLQKPEIQGKKLLLHSCCAPCSSYCMEYLREYLELTVLYYNPNITEAEEYRKRVDEERRLIEAYNRMPGKRGIRMVEGVYEPQRFYELAKGLEQVPEGGERCFRCYELRLRETARMAAEEQYDFFTTTLTISPLKNAEKLNEIGERMAQEYGTVFLNSDFKKRDGYKRSIELSAEYGLYRQDYCGCVFSKGMDVGLV